jgi:hypothetical protein
MYGEHQAASKEIVVAGTVLALGGIFSWLAFVSKILSEERLKSLQASADRRLFSNRRWRTPLVVTVVAGIVSTQFCGSIDVSSTGTVDRSIWIDQDAANLAELPDRLSATTSFRGVYTTNWRSPRQIRVKVSGYPATVVSVRPGRRVDLRVPGSFVSTPVLLLRPTPALIRNLSKGWRIRVTVNGQQQPDEPLEDGRTVWVGCDENVEVPQRLLDLWAATPGAPPLALWKTPHALGNGKLTLKPFSSVDVAVLNDIFHFERQLFHAADRVLDSRPHPVNNMKIRFELFPKHPDGTQHAILAVDVIMLNDRVQECVLRRNAHLAGVDLYILDVLLIDFVAILRQRDRTAIVKALNVRPRHAHVDTANHHVAFRFRIHHRFMHAFHRRFEINDFAFAYAA